mgnify:CR=1 FL=1
MSEIIKVGMADLKTCVSPDGVTTLGRGDKNRRSGTYYAAGQHYDP